MSSKSTNYNLDKPVVTDKVKDVIAGIATSMETLDTQLKSAHNKADALSGLPDRMDTAESDIQTHSDEIGNLSVTVSDHTSQLAENAYSMSNFPIIIPETDDVPRLQRAIDKATLDNARLELGHNTYQIVSSFVNITCDLIGDKATFVIAPSLSEGVIVGYKDPSKLLTVKKIILPSVTRTTKDWTVGTGVVISNINESHIFGGLVQNFKVGVKITAYSQGTVYNQIDFAYLFNNEINLRIEPGDLSGWVNENIFYLNRMSYSNDSPGTVIVGTKHISLYSENNGINNNVFIKPNVEGDSEYTFHIINGGYNTFISPRFEGTLPKIKYGSFGTKYSIGNVVLYGYHAESVTYEIDTGCVYNNALTSRGSTFHGSDTKATLKLSNTAGGEAGAWSVFDSATNPLLAALNDYVLKVTQYALHIKQKADVYERIKLTNAGYAYFGSGTSSPAQYLRSYGSDLMVGGGNFIINNGAWNTEHLRMGGYHLWIDATGELRIKNGSPTSDTDGVTVGSQT